MADAVCEPRLWANSIAGLRLAHASVITGEKLRMVLKKTHTLDGNPHRSLATEANNFFRPLLESWTRRTK